MGLICCPETSVQNYHPTLRNIPEERRYNLHQNGSQKSRIVNNELGKTWGSGRRLIGRTIPVLAKNQTRNLPNINRLRTISAAMFNGQLLSIKIMQKMKKKPVVRNLTRKTLRILVVFPTAG
jgi:hypothetical protein